MAFEMIFEKARWIAFLRTGNAGSGAPLPAFPVRKNAIQRAFSNIISNAIRYSTKTNVSLRIHNDEVTFSFDDNGAGIPEERRQDAIRPDCILSPLFRNASTIIIKAESHFVIMNPQ